MRQIAGNVCHRLEVLKDWFSSVSSILWVDKCNTMKITLVTCAPLTMLVQGCLTIILTISISVIRSARKMIIFCFPRFWVDKFNEIKISSVTCTFDLVGQGRLTTILTISISAIRGARKMIIFLFSTFFG